MPVGQFLIQVLHTATGWDAGFGFGGRSSAEGARMETRVGYRGWVYKRIPVVHALSQKGLTMHRNTHLATKKMEKKIPGSGSKIARDFSVESLLMVHWFCFIVHHAIRFLALISRSVLHYRIIWTLFAELAISIDRPTRIRLIDEATVHIKQCLIGLCRPTAIESKHNIRFVYNNERDTSIPPFLVFLLLVLIQYTKAAL